MSRIGRMPIAIPAGVTVEVNGNVVTAKGSKGELVKEMHPDMIIEVNGSEVIVSRPSENKMHKSLHGLTRTLVNNMIVGVNEGFKKELEVKGVGYRVAMEGNVLVMNLGFSHQVKVEPVDGITITAPTPNQIVVSGLDKQLVGQIAADIRKKREPEPYKGKGIRYAGEVVRTQEGKTGGKKT